ncbi:MAG TPA: stage II sporulation protein M [Gemmatimonadaceae bacterium]
MTSRAAPVDRPRGLEQIHSVETPEHVELSYTIAGLGSRLFAGLIDASMIIIGYALAIAALAFLGSRAPQADGARVDMSASWAFALLYLGQFAFMWGYYVLWEGLADGRTPGKRAMRLRVVQEDGLSVSFAASAVRNIMRLVDLQPGLLAGAGIISMLVTRRSKRIGDIVAGTIVVRERPIAVAGAQPQERTAAGDTALSEPEFNLLHRYVERRSALRADERNRLARIVADRLRPHLAAHSGPDAAALLRLHARELALRSSGVAARSDTGGAREQHALIASGRPRWAEFARLLEKAQRRGLKGLSESEVVEFATRYREMASDLARLRTATRGRALDDVFAVGRLVAAGHNLLYRGKRVTLDRALVFVAADAPREVRRSLRWILAAALLFWVPAVVSYVGVARHPEVAAEFLPREILDRAESAAANPGSAYVEIPDMYRPLAATAIIANNVQVALGAFALGVTLGIGTTLILLLNGIAIGGVTGLFAAKGVAGALMAFVAPHGVLELTAIAIAGGAGLLIGGGLLLGGPGGRRATVVRNARRAITLMAGVIFLLIVAGLIEGLVSPRSDRPLSWKLAISGATAVVMLAWLAVGGRGRVSQGAAPLDLEVPVHDRRADGA